MQPISTEMKNIPQSHYISFVLQILIWLTLLLLPYVVSNAANHYSIGSIPASFFSINWLIHLVLFYGNAFYLVPKLFKRQYWGFYILTSTVLVLLSYVLKYNILKVWFPALVDDQPAHKFIFAPSIVIVVISFIYRMVVDRIRFEKEQADSRAEQLANELKFLRSQISPHFMFNVLTNLVSLARKKSDQLETSLITLSDLMRYMLYETQHKKIELRKEIAYLDNYMALQMLRFANDVKIDYKVNLNDLDADTTIEPMLLIPFVENAFKHGTGSATTPWMMIRLEVDRRKLHFEVKNPYGAKIEPNGIERSGIGLGNIKLRLDLLYKNSYSLTINNKENIFHVILTLQLS